MTDALTSCPVCDGMFGTRYGASAHRLFESIGRPYQMVDSDSAIDIHRQSESLASLRSMHGAVSMEHDLCLVLLRMATDADGSIFGSEHDYSDIIDLCGGVIDLFVNHGFDWTATALSSAIDCMAATGNAARLVRMQSGAPRYIRQPELFQVAIRHLLEDSGPWSTGAHSDDPVVFGRALAGAWADVYDRSMTAVDAPTFPTINLFTRWRDALSPSSPECVSTAPSMQWSEGLLRMTPYGLLPIANRLPGQSCAVLVDALESDGSRDYGSVVRWSAEHWGIPDPMFPDSIRSMTDEFCPPMDASFVDEWNRCGGSDAPAVSTPAAILALLDIYDVLIMATGGDPYGGVNSNSRIAIAGPNVYDIRSMMIPNAVAIHESDLAQSDNWGNRLTLMRKTHADTAADLISESLVPATTVAFVADMLDGGCPKDMVAEHPLLHERKSEGRK